MRDKKSLFFSILIFLFIQSTNLILAKNNQTFSDNPSISMNIETTEKNNGFLKCRGKYIVDQNNNEVLLKGIGLGNYMILEPYMLGIKTRIPGKSDTQHAIVNALKSIAGNDPVDKFLDAYRANYLTKTDVDSLKAWGLNSIRLPMHYNLFIQEAIGNDAFVEKGFTMVDSLLHWCEKNEMYLILDMHAVPGGQGNDKAISDQNNPGLWLGNENGTAAQYQDKLVVLWKEIARRYADKKWIGGYDLINETNYVGPEMPLSLVNLMKRLTTAIREVDVNHIIFIEGNGYANDFNGLTPPWDNNMAYSFHRYWNGNENASIKWVLDIRNTYDVPLWMGESGENSNHWFSEAIDLLENNKIGWSWWAYKKTSSVSAFASITRPENWDKVLSYLHSPTDNSAAIGLTASVLTTALNDFAENAKLQHCKINKDMIYAMMEQPHNNNTKPYSPNVVPGKIYATEYDMGRNLFAYSDTEWANYSGAPGSISGAYNKAWVGRNDGVDIETTNDIGGNGFNVGSTTQGEWLKYTVNAQVAGKYQIQARYAVSGKGNITIKVNGKDALKNINMEDTKDWTSYQTAMLGSVNLNAGVNEIIVYFNAGIHLSYLLFTGDEENKTKK